MIRQIVLLVSLGLPFASAADQDYVGPRQVLQEDGVLRIADGSSMFEFRRDGVFESGPLGVSGRTFKGTWRSEGDNPMRITAKASESWLNGGGILNDYAG